MKYKIYIASLFVVILLLVIPSISAFNGKIQNNRSNFLYQSESLKEDTKDIHSIIEDLKNIPEINNKSIRSRIWYRFAQYFWIRFLISGLCYEKYNSPLFLASTYLGMYKLIAWYFIGVMRGFCEANPPSPIPYPFPHVELPPIIMEFINRIFG